MLSQTGKNLIARVRTLYLRNISEGISTWRYTLLAFPIVGPCARDAAMPYVSPDDRFMDTFTGH